MNVLFLTLVSIETIKPKGIYTDLMRKFRDEGHQVYIVSPYERRFGKQTDFTEVDGVHLLGVKTLNIQKTNFIEKGIGTILLERQFERAIRKYLKGIRFDLILYSTPPITLSGLVGKLKETNGSAISYLLLKDIFPQNAVDLDMFSSRGLFYRYFRAKEVGLYKASDYIGCMSPANRDFILRHNTFLQANRVEVAPNSIELQIGAQVCNRDSVRKKYGIPLELPVFIYGGNLGKPQGIPFLIQCLEANKDRTDCYFLIVGSGTEYLRIKAWYDAKRPKNIKVIQGLPKDDYDKLVKSCDVGMIFLDHRFTIPNYPSRLLSYLESRMPVLAATDVNTDIGKIAEENHYGLWCESTNVAAFTSHLNHFIDNPSLIQSYGENGYRFLLENYSIDNTYRKIVAHF